jgi:hypothetical protein
MREKEMRVELLVCKERFGKEVEEVKEIKEAKETAALRMRLELRPEVEMRGDRVF